MTSYERHIVFLSYDQVSGHFAQYFSSNGRYTATSTMFKYGECELCDLFRGALFGSLCITDKAAAYVERSV